MMLALARTACKFGVARLDRMIDRKTVKTSSAFLQYFLAFVWIGDNRAIRTKMILCAKRARPCIIDKGAAALRLLFCVHYEAGGGGLHIVKLRCLGNISARLGVDLFK